MDTKACDVIRLFVVDEWAASRVVALLGSFSSSFSCCPVYSQVYSEPTLRNVSKKYYINYDFVSASTGVHGFFFRPLVFDKKLNYK